MTITRHNESKALDQRNITRETADFLLNGGNVTYWPKGHRVLTHKEASEIDTIAHHCGHTENHPLPYRHVFKQPRRIRRFALCRR